MGRNEGPRIPNQGESQVKERLKRLAPALPTNVLSLPNQWKPTILIEQVLRHADSVHEQLMDVFFQPFLRHLRKRLYDPGDYIDFRSNGFVTVYRCINQVRDLDTFDLNSNYRGESGSNRDRGLYGKDYVDTWLRHLLLNYAEESADTMIVRYEIPALLLNCDDGVDPHFVIDPAKMRHHGVASVSPFVSGMGRIHLPRFNRSFLRRHFVTAAEVCETGIIAWLPVELVSRSVERSLNGF